MKGIACPRSGCAGNNRVLESRVDRYGIRRRRLCLKCKNRFTTYEVHAHMIDQLEQATQFRKLLQQFLTTTEPGT